MRPFRPLRRLGHGSMAEVHLAELRVAGGAPRRVAVKRILPALRLDPEVRRRFAEEAELCAQLHHENIVRVIRAQPEGDEPYIALELLSGPSVQDVLDRLEGTPCDPGLAHQIGRSVASALAYAHRLKGEDGRSMSLMHRDVSPKNLLFDAEGTLKLIDFGLARGARPRRTHTGAVIGDATYLSPEQSRGDVADSRSDVFSAALILYVLCTGVHPFVADSQLKQLERIDRCRVKVPERLGVEVPDALVRVMIRALSREPQDRYRDGGEWLEALDRAAPEVPGANPDAARARLAELGFALSGPEATEVTMPQAPVDRTATMEAGGVDLGTLADPGTLVDPGTVADLVDADSDSESELGTLKDLRRPGTLVDPSSPRRDDD